MPAYAVAKVELSLDPLSDTTPAWTEVTRYCQGASWSSGKAKDLDDSQAGGATIVLRNDQRRFEPEYSGGAYYPNIRPMRRFRLSVVTSSGTTLQGIYYATDWAVSYPAGTDYSVVTVTCVDGFGILSLAHLPALDPTSAASLADVIMADNPFAFYRLAETFGTTMTADAGPEGKYLDSILLGQPPLAVGATDTSAIFVGVSGTARGRAQLPDINVFHDANAVTIEAVVQYPAGGNRPVMSGPFSTTAGDAVFVFGQAFFTINTTNGAFNLALGATINDRNVHHVACSWDGNAMRVYVDGALTAFDSSPNGVLRAGDSGEYLYVGNSGALLISTVAVDIQYAAFYEYALTADRVSAHADAALRRGRTAETAGDRIANLVTNPLWSTAGIGPSSLVVSPRVYAGQPILDEVTTTAQAERPIGIFYFDDQGNPAYYAWDDTRLATPAAIFGDGSGEIHYQAISIVYDDELYNQVTSSRDGGNSIEVDDAASQAEFYIRSYDASNLILNTDADAARVGQTILDRFNFPMFRVESITLSGATPGALTQILAREIGDTIRVRRLSASATPIDIVTTILGKSKSIDVAGNLSCTWNLARGFNALTTVWRLGVNGYDELGQTAVLG